MGRKTSQQRLQFPMWPLEDGPAGAAATALGLSWTCGMGSRGTIAAGVILALYWSPVLHGAGWRYGTRLIGN